jgi:putative ABC transport system substrate-binding protein
VLAGRPPGEIPIERPITFTLSCNLTTAKTLGLTIPRSLLARADQIVD